jgi:PAS domain S-box-containing protein
VSQAAGPIGASVVALLYLRRATVGLEDHLKPLAASFFLLSISELFGLMALFQTSTNVAVFQLVAPFGPVWILSLVFLFLCALVLCRWVFGYLLKQFQAQLFMIYTTTILGIFLLTTVAFTGLLLRNMETESRRQIETDVKVLDFALSSQREQLLSDVQSIAANQSLQDALVEHDRKKLGDMATSELLAKHFTNFIILSETGQVLARGEERDRVGDSLIQDPLVKRALIGESHTTIVSKDGVLAPDLTIRATASMRNPQGAVIGIVLAGKGIDAAFVDGMKKTTGLDASVYGDAIVSATTFLSPDGFTRVVGMKEEHPEVISKVLRNGALYAGSLPMRGIEYISAFLPLKDVDGNAVGMLFVGRPQSEILKAAGSSIQYTFIITALLGLCVFRPIFKISCKCIMDILSDKLYRTLVESSVDLVTLMKEDGTILYESPAVVTLLGYDQGELLHKNILTYLHPADLPRVLAMIAEGRVLRGKAYSARIRFKVKDGSWKWLESTATYLPPESEINGILIHTRVLPDQKKVESENTQAEVMLRKFKHIIESLHQLSL